ncbi:MAG: DUF2510 domain-containing protein [Actinomycetota bacterium]|nr:DUF2510 domain-containing protein [Actinomycetota bacterium]
MTATTDGLSTSVVALVAILALLALIPIIWAIVDVLRRPSWQFSTARKVLWVLTLGVGWLIFWPISLVSSIVYLAVLRRRFPVAIMPPAVPTWDNRVETTEIALRDLPPADWYPDPAGSPGLRWWDGLGWTAYLRTSEHGDAPKQPDAPPGESEGGQASG